MKGRDCRLELVLCAGSSGKSYNQQVGNQGTGNSQTGTLFSRICRKRGPEDAGMRVRGAFDEEFLC